MRKKIFRNWGLKLVSLGIAVALWFLAVQVNDPQETRSFSNIKVNLTNTELLEQENKAYEVLDNTDTVRVTVRAPKSVIDSLRATDIVAEADVSKLTEINTIAINYSIQNVDVDVDERSITGNHDVVKLSVEEKRTKWVSIQYNTVGAVAEGYMVSSVTPDQTLLEISGPKSAVDRVKYAGVEIDVTGATRDVSANIEILLYDVEGKRLNISGIFKNADYVHMYVEVLSTKEVPVEVSTQGTPAQGYLPTGVVENNVDTVLIAGKSLTLAGISKITIPAEDLDITDRTTSLIKTVNIKDYLPTNVKLADSNFNGKVTVTVYVEPVVEKVIQIPDYNIAMLNIPETTEFKYTQHDEPYTVTVSGLNAEVETVNLNDITITADVKAWMEQQKLEVLAPGEYEIPATVKVTGDVEYNAEMTVKATFYEIEDEEEE